jgi:hypothetical protein
LNESLFKKFNTAPVRAGIVLVIGFLVIGITAWRTYPRAGKHRAAVPADAKFMHCPKCLNEMQYDPMAMDNECLLCGYDKGFEATVESIKQTGTKNAYGRMLAFLLPEVVVLLGSLWFVLKPRAGGYQEEFRYMRCQNCGQKLRYRKAQVGQLGACSKCKRAFRFPDGTPREQDLDGAYAYEHEEVAEED